MVQGQDGIKGKAEKHVSRRLNIPPLPQTDMAGQLTEGAAFCQAHPATLSSLAWLSLTSALGQNFIFLTIQLFDALVLTTVTTTRKFFTILLSVRRRVCCVSFRMGGWGVAPSAFFLLSAFLPSLPPLRL